MSGAHHRFDGRVAVVTGAGRGLGRAYAELLATRGAAVVVNDLGVAASSGGEASAAPAEETVAHLVARGHRAVASFADVSDAAQAEGIVDAALEAFGRIDIVINNAGTLVNGSLEQQDLTTFSRDLGIHLGGAFNVTRAAWPHLRKQGYGRVVLTCSTSLFGQEHSVSYCTAKGGLLGMTRALAVEGAPHGILVNAIAPSATTRMTADPLRGVEQSVAPPELVAPAVAWLAHEECRRNGELLHAGSGRVSRIFLGETRGLFDPALTIEQVADGERTVDDATGYVVPTDVFEATGYHRSVTQPSEVGPGHASS